MTDHSTKAYWLMFLVQAVAISVTAGFFAGVLPAILLGMTVAYASTKVDAISYRDDWP